MGIRIGLIILLLVSLIIILWRLIQLAEKNYHAVGKRDNLEEVVINCELVSSKKDLIWVSWDNSYADLSELLSLLVSYGNIFGQAISNKRFYFRELLRRVESLSALRRWLIKAQLFGFVTKKKDSRGAYYYEISRAGLMRAIKFIENALDDLK